MRVTESEILLAKSARDALGPWRKFTIGIDGRFRMGKSVLARYLAWGMDMPAIHLDSYIVHGATAGTEYRFQDLARILSDRHELDRPVIVEGSFLLRVLMQIDVSCDYLVYVKENFFVEDQDSLSDIGQAELDQYLEEYRPEEKAQHVFVSREPC